MKYFFPIGILFCTSLSAQQSCYDLARVAYFSGQYEEALISIQQCIELDTANYQYFFLKGKTLENLYRFDEAIIAQQKVLLLNPDAAEAQSALGALHLQTGQPAVSAQFYEQLAIAEPSVNRWKINWATALQAAGKPNDALEQLKIVAQNDTTNWLVYKNMGDCYHRLDSLYQTFDNYYRALSLYPQNKNLWGTLTRLLVVNDQLEGAIEVGSKAVVIDSTNVDAWKYLGIAYNKAGFRNYAYSALQKTLALGDSSFITLNHYGAVNYELSNYEEAEKNLLKAHQLDPNDISTMRYLARTYGYTGKAQKGLDVLKKIDDIIARYDTIGMKVNVQRGDLLRRLNRDSEAVQCFITATKNFPDDLQNYYKAALCYDTPYSKKQALDWYTRYLEKIAPDWQTKEWTEQELKEFKFVSISMRRVESLMIDLLLEEEK